MYLMALMKIIFSHLLEYIKLFLHVYRSRIPSRILEILFLIFVKYWNESAMRAHAWEVIFLASFIILNLVSCSKHLTGSTTERVTLMGTYNWLSRQVVENGNHSVRKEDSLVI